MRFLLAVCLAGFCAVHAQSVGDENAHCIERLSLPVYPKLADLARISGTVTAPIVLAAGGSIEKTALDMGLATEKAKNLFQSSVEEALRTSAFRKDCAGKTVTLVFHFVLDEDLDANGLPERISFGFPNRFWITMPYLGRAQP